MKYPDRVLPITILLHAIEYTGANTINATYAQRMMARSDLIPSNIQRFFVFGLAVFFYGMI